MTDIYRGNHPHLQKADQGRRASNMRLFLQTEDTSIQSPPEDATHFINSLSFSTAGQCIPILLVGGFVIVRCTPESPWILMLIGSGR